ncbi:hypothetical protein BD309DRAFT_1023864 [Dichomitus squalens]|uniref:3-oxo-5-alpha-steroid 4-dehydrogenase C-terminal domain-containing protein n=1 Tax=Dichomitus squalens TaxID=114155 RepID=A0A4Q9PWI6_9APHY|nr:hypothetical protein BD309DRAFT_1023864 [Dichomitus squalens]TBU58961.1 hypothetical protein BD310DRAFT_977009 [Dichomitus squalens]
MTHYLNRTLISPLRTSSLSRPYLMIAISAVFFNTVNGSLLGTYLSSPPAQSFLADAFARLMFWLGLTLWVAGITGNVTHEILNIRRNAKKASDDTNNGKDKPKEEHYAILHGLLYRFISYLNYFCEWAE